MRSGTVWQAGVGSGVGVGVGSGVGVGAGVGRGVGRESAGGRRRGRLDVAAGVEPGVFGAGRVHRRVRTDARDRRCTGRRPRSVGRPGRVGLAGPPVAPGVVVVPPGVSVGPLVTAADDEVGVPDAPDSAPETSPLTSPVGRNAAPMLRSSNARVSTIVPAASGARRSRGMGPAAADRGLVAATGGTGADAAATATGAAASTATAAGALLPETEVWATRPPQRPRSPQGPRAMDRQAPVMARPRVEWQGTANRRRPPQPTRPWLQLPLQEPQSLRQPRACLRRGRSRGSSRRGRSRRCRDARTRHRRGRRPSRRHGRRAVGHPADRAGVSSAPAQHQRQA